MRVLSLCLLAVFAVTNAHAQSGDATWKQLHFLIGTWEAKTSAQGSAGANVIGTYTFSEDLNGNAITRTSSEDKCAGPKDFNCQHHDALTIYREGAEVAALYIDGEGHVIHYTVTTPDDHTALFLSPAGMGPVFRLRYQKTAALMSGSFGMAAPGSQEFHSYLEWSGTSR